MSTLMNKETIKNNKLPVSERNKDVYFIRLQAPYKSETFLHKLEQDCLFIYIYIKTSAFDPAYTVQLH